MAVFPLSNKCFFPAKCFSTASRCSASSASDLPRQLIWIPPRSLTCGPPSPCLLVCVDHQPSGGGPQQHWERALQEHIFHHHELPHGVRLQRLDWWRPGDRSRTMRSPTPALLVPRQALHLLKTSPAAAQQNAVKSRCARLVHRRVPQVEDGTAMRNAAVLVRGPASVPQFVRRDQPEHFVPLEPQRTSRSTAWLEQCDLTRRRDTSERAHPASVRRLVPQRGDDQEPGVRMA